MASDSKYASPGPMGAVIPPQCCSRMLLRAASLGLRDAQARLFSFCRVCRAVFVEFSPQSKPACNQWKVFADLHHSRVCRSFSLIEWKAFPFNPMT